MKKFKMGTMDKILIIIATFLLLFVITMIFIYCLTGGIPETLCTCVFTICGGECGAMAWIKTNKDRHQERQYELEDRTYEEEKEEQL